MPAFGTVLSVKWRVGWVVTTLGVVVLIWLLPFASPLVALLTGLVFAVATHVWKVRRESDQPD